MRCRAGDLCYIVVGRNSGRVVTTLEWHAARALHGAVGAWWTQSRGLIATDQGPSHGAYIPDSWLRPIRGDESGDTTTESVNVPKTIRTDEKVSA